MPFRLTPALTDHTQEHSSAEYGPEFVPYIVIGFVKRFYHTVFGFLTTEIRRLMQGYVVTWRGNRPTDKSKARPYVLVSGIRRK